MDRSQWRLAIEQVGGIALFARDAALAIVTFRFSWRDVLHQCDRIGVQSLTIVNVCAVFTGMVLALQTAYELQRFGAKLFVGRVVAVSFVRELGPVFSALMIAGRVGTGIAAEIGGMRIGRQIDALKVMGVDPMSVLVAPRIVAAMIILPMLTVVVLLLGIMAGLVVVQLQFNVSYDQYLNSTLAALSLEDIAWSLFKTFVFGLLVVLISCYLGYYAKGGTTGVGKATTRAMVTSSICILVSDFIITKLGQSPIISKISSQLQDQLSRG